VKPVSAPPPRREDASSAEEGAGLVTSLRAGKGGAVEPSDLRNARLVGADLSGVDLSGLDLSGADLTKADLTGARLMGTQLVGAVLAGALLDGAELLGANLSKADLSDIKASRAGFGGANLTEADLFNAVLEEATFSRADLTNADLRAARLRGARLRNATLANCNFEKADLTEADLECSEVGGANFTDGILQRARLRKLTGFMSAKWVGADIMETDFCGAYAVRRTIMDENYLYEFRNQGKLNNTLYWVWWATSDCGRSMVRWAGWTVGIALGFAALFPMVEVDFGPNETWLSPLYYSVVTLTTLGYGDILPISVAAQAVAMVEVVIGYVMLGGLLSIFSSKMARRAD